MTDVPSKHVVKIKKVALFLKISAKHVVKILKSRTIFENFCGFAAVLAI